MSNPYSAPTATLSEPDSADQTYTPSMFSVHGRIGRLRYLAYTFLSMILVSIVFGIAGALLSKIFHIKELTGGGVFIILLANIPVFAVSFIMAKRRLNDLDRSGWMSLIMLIPIVNFFFGLYLIFGAGSDHTNDYGPRPEKNSALLVIAGLILPIVFVVGIVAAVSIPAYQQYKMRANAASQTVRP